MEVHFSSSSTSQQSLTQVITSCFSSPFLQLASITHSPHFPLSTLATPTQPLLLGPVSFLGLPRAPISILPLIWLPSLHRIAGSHGSKYSLYMNDAWFYIPSLVISPGLSSYISTESTLPLGCFIDKLTVTKSELQKLPPTTNLHVNKQYHHWPDHQIVGTI